MTSTKFVDENDEEDSKLCRRDDNDVCDDDVTRTPTSTSENGESKEERLSCLVISNGNSVMLNNLDNFKNESAEIFTVTSSDDTTTTIVNASSTFTSDICSIANDNATSDIEVIAQ